MTAADIIAIIKICSDVGMTVLPLIIHKNDAGQDTGFVLLPMTQDTAEKNAQIMAAVISANAQPKKD